MAAEVSRACYGWPHEGLPGQDQSQGALVSRMRDHGSVTFRRFAVEALSWEEGSVFSFNSRQEELEKCIARRFVSQGRVYSFEEFYKNLRADKAQSKQPTVRFSGRSNSCSAAAPLSTYFIIIIIM